MARAKAGGVDTSGEGSLSARLVSRFSQDKDIGGVIKLGSGSLRSDIPYYISTQVATVDYAIGQPGIPASRVTTIYGREGSGKSTLVYHILAECQRMGGISVLVDSEQRFTRARAGAMGLNANDLLVVDGATLEKAFDAIEKVIDFARNDNFDIPICVAYDSLAGSVSKKRLDAEVGTVVTASVAKFVNAELPRLKMKCSEHGVALVIVNQVRSRIQDFSDPRSRGYQERNKVMGSKQAMIAEWPLLFESSLMLYVNTTGTLGSDPLKPEGVAARVKVTKSGISPHEGWRGNFELGENGINLEQAKWDVLEMVGIIEHASGGWYTIRLAPGAAPMDKKMQRKDFATLLTQHPELDKIVQAAPTLWKTGNDEQLPTGEDAVQPDEAD